MFRIFRGIVDVMRAADTSYVQQTVQLAVIGVQSWQFDGGIVTLVVAVGVGEDAFEIENNLHCLSSVMFTTAHEAFDLNEM